MTIPSASAALDANPAAISFRSEQDVGPQKRASNPLNTILLLIPWKNLAIFAASCILVPQHSTAYLNNLPKCVYSLCLERNDESFSDADNLRYDSLNDADNSV